MTHHLRALANYSTLGTFAGMVTDSRSYLSGIRHELFRRVLAGELSQLIQTGQLPNDPAALAPLVRAVCYENAREWIVAGASCPRKQRP
jgi:glucuronate isomerase